jgi:hypothetical protein
MWEGIRKNIASGILTTMAIGLVTVFFGMFAEVQTLKASGMTFKHTFSIIEKRLERIEKKNDKIIDKLMEMQ